MISFVDNLAYIDHISNPLHHLYMNIVLLFHYILFHVNQPDGNCILITDKKERNNHRLLNEIDARGFSFSIYLSSTNVDKIICIG